MNNFKFSFFAETLLLLAVVIFVDHSYFSGDRFWGVHPHPFFFIVLLISVQYGASEGLISALLASCALLAGNLPEQNFSQDYYSYLISTGHQPLIWSVSAIILGTIRDRYIEERRELENKLTYSQKQVEVFSKACEISDFERKRLETHVAGQSSFLLSMHQNALDMGAVEPVQILDHILEITQRVTKSEKCSWFKLDNSILETHSQLGWDIDETYSRAFTALSPIFQKVVGHRRILSITNEEDEGFLDGQGMLAGPIVSGATGKVYGMLKIEKLDFLSLNSESVQTFKQLCEWMGTLLDPPDSFNEENRVINADPNHRLHSNSYFERLSEFLTLTADKIGYDNQSITLRPPREVLNSENLQREVEAAINKSMHDLLGDKTLFFEGQKSNSEFVVVLANTSPKNAKKLAVQLLEALNDQLSSQINISEFAVSIKSVGAKSETGTATHH